MTAQTARTRMSPIRTTERIGLTGRSRPVRALSAIVVGAAPVVCLLGLALPVPRFAVDAIPAAAGVGLAAVLACAGQLARQRFRVGRGTVSVSWGEAAFILGYALAPPGWLPLLTLAGTLGAWMLISWLQEQRTLAEILPLAASLSLGAAGAAVVTTAIAGDAPPASLRMQVALVAGATVFLLVTFGLAVTVLTLHHDAPPAEIVARALHAKLPMFAGNVLVGLFGLFVLGRSPQWLLAFLPALYLLQRTYRHHLWAEEERLTWETFARAVADLPAATEAAAVVEAGLRGAFDVFGARRVEIEVQAPAGGRRFWTQDAPGLDVAAGGLPGPVLTRTMAAGGQDFGELSVWLPEPSSPVTRDELALSAYGDALAGALHDAAARERLSALDTQLAHQARHDTLTGLLNRPALVADGDRRLKSFDRDHPVALVLLDLNRFREVNGTLGFRAGDAVLEVVAERITDVCRDGDLIARLGDDEFAVLLPTVSVLADSAALHAGGPSPMPRALRRARELLDVLAAPMEISGVRLALESTAGVAVDQAGRTDLNELVRRAAIALDQAKEQHSGIATYDAARDPSSTDHLAMLAELRDALDAGDQIVVHLQPAVDLQTSAPTGVESLARWQHPRRGLLAPGVFIDTVEDSELLSRFTRYILDRSLTSAAAWRSQGIDVPVSVNISARNLLDSGFPQQIADLLRQHGLRPPALVLEITESVALSEQDIVDENLAELRASGIQISVDDFGTGFSSLSFLTRVPVDELKVDRSFVEEMIDSTVAEAVVRGAVELGDRLGARVIAEGVETAEQRAALIALGCTSAQGFHFCRPLPADKIVGALRQLTDSAPPRIVPLRADGAS